LGKSPRKSDLDAGAAICGKLESLKKLEKFPNLFRDEKVIRDGLHK
jgi:hypothetical protein